MTVSTLIHVNMVNGTGPTEGRVPSFLLPGLENLTALHAMQVYCRDENGNVLRSEPAGWIGRIVRDVGSLAVVELTVQSQYWTLITDSFSSDRPMVTGQTIDAFTLAVMDRRVALLELLANTHTAQAIAADDPTWWSVVAPEVTDIAGTDPILASCAKFIEARVGGVLTAALPTVFGSDFTSLNYETLRQFGQDWRAASESDPIRRVTRLWELARMQTLSLGL
jgi:hypothetical protein